MIGKKLEIKLSEIGMSKYESAKRSGLSRSYVGLICSDKRGKGMTIDTARRLADVLGVQLSFFDMVSERISGIELETGGAKRDARL